ncbi:hypothetical protein EC9_16800 [Rosistilla ulvae]|uniref:DUF1559 domain-containing protein n=1 Tax=Rosistilla ulvae TaxID=1930277 RepID=A0A517LY01_9BACT|nr:DUF1559 domain-containing protein [Rosistilla ulvae]QDS87501.1 hypothetical protein EC9_16800 [Rosistilla ulvae]
MRSNRHPGFTMTEVLASLVIVGIVASVLLPAVQAARKESRRMQCSNNLKQIGLALHNYHDSHLKFPYGDEGVSGGWGSNWRIRLLPYCEQTALYDQWQYGKGHGWIFTAIGKENRQLIDGVAIGWGKCASSPLQDFLEDSGDQLFMFNYFGISGAENSPDGSYVASARNTAIPADNHPGGIYTADGMLPVNEMIGIDQCTDGTSNTLIVGEISDYILDAARIEKQDLRPGFHWGWQMGAAKPGKGASAFVTSATVTVRYSPNANVLWADGASVGGGWRRNTPLASAHPGGAQVARVDGSVYFVNERIDINTLTYLSVRNDGQAIRGR